MSLVLRSILTANLGLCGWAAMCWILGTSSTRVPLGHHQFCPWLCILMNFRTTSTCLPMPYWLWVLVHLSKAQYRIWDFVDFCALEADELFITNERHILPRRVFPNSGIEGLVFAQLVVLVRMLLFGILYPFHNPNIRNFLNINWHLWGLICSEENLWSNPYWLHSSAEMTDTTNGKLLHEMVRDIYLVHGLRRHSLALLCFFLTVGEDDTPDGTRHPVRSVVCTSASRFSLVTCPFASSLYDMFLSVGVMTP